MKSIILLSGGLDSLVSLGIKYKELNIDLALTFDYGQKSLDKEIQEKRSLINIKDNFKKMIIVKDSIKPYLTEEGIEVINLKDWLLK